MKTSKMNLANIQGKLSRQEMKKIMAGSDDLCFPAYTCACSGVSGTFTCCGSTYMH